VRKFSCGISPRDFAAGNDRIKQNGLSVLVVKIAIFYDIESLEFSSSGHSFCSGFEIAQLF